MNKEIALQQIHDSRAALLAGIEGLNEEDVSSYTVEGNWPVRDLLIHIAAWDQTCVEPLRQYAAGGRFSAHVVEDHDQFNADQISIRHGRDYQAVLAELNTVRADLLELAGRLSEDQWAARHDLPWGEIGTIANALSGLAWHENEHLESILRWRATVSLPERKSL